MSNVIDFPNAVGAGVADMIESFAQRARDGELPGAIIIAINDDGPEFQMRISGAGTNALLAAIGALDVIKARLVHVVEADQHDDDCA